MWSLSPTGNIIFHIHRVFSSLQLSQNSWFEKDDIRDVTKALALINQYVSQFEIGQVFQTEEEFSHYFMCPSLPGLVVSYVVEDPITASITDLFGLIIQNFYIDNVRFAQVIAITPTKTVHHRPTTVCQKRTR